MNIKQAFMWVAGAGMAFIIIRAVVIIGMILSAVYLFFVGDAKAQPAPVVPGVSVICGDTVGTIGVEVTVGTLTFKYEAVCKGVRV